MSMKEQRFSALDSFADRYDIVFQIAKEHYYLWISDGTGIIWNSGNCKSSDEAMTQALRYLRRINKPPKP